MKGLIVLANGFEDSEAIVTIDILRRANIQIDLANVESNGVVTSQYNNKIETSKSFKEMDTSKYDFLVIPGGKAVSKTLVNNKKLEKTILDFSKQEKLICAICAGPFVVGKLGLFQDKKYTCFPGFEKDIVGKYTGNGVTVHNNYITAKSMAYSIEFGLEIVNYLLGKEEKKNIEKMIFAKV